MSSILCIGNFGTGDENQYEVTSLLKYLIEKYKCKFILGLGNNLVNFKNKNDFIEKFEEPYKDLLKNIKFYNIFGNEDYKIKNLVKEQIKYSKQNKSWILPNNFYCFKKILNKIPIQFIAIDTNFKNLSKSIINLQEKWLINTILDSKTRWNIIYTHYPITKCDENYLLDDFYEKILNIKKVDLIISGHNKYQQHIYIPNKPNIIISGVGGMCDTNNLINFKIYKEIKYISNNLGCAMLEFTKNNLKISFFNINKEKEYNFVIHKI